MLSFILQSWKILVMTSRGPNCSASPVTQALMLSVPRMASWHLRWSTGTTIMVFICVTLLNWKKFTIKGSISLFAWFCITPLFNPFQLNNKYWICWNKIIFLLVWKQFGSCCLFGKQQRNHTIKLYLSFSGICTYFTPVSFFIGIWINLKVSHTRLTYR